MRALTIPTKFTAVDKFSGPVDKMSKNASASFHRLDRNMRKASKQYGDMSKKAAITSAAIIAPLALLANEAVKFEDKMADVAKVANVDLGSDAFLKMGEDAKNLGIQLGLTANESAALMANLAQGGVNVKDLNEVSLIAGKMAVAFGMSGDLAGESFIKTKNALGGTIEETQKVMDVINMFGNTTAAASDQLVEFMASGGSAVARVANASGQELSAFGAQFISMGKSASESATIMERFIKSTMQNKKLRSIFDEAGGGSEGMMDVIRKGAKLSGKAQDEYFSNFGQYGLSIQLLAKNFEGKDSLTEKILMSNDALLSAGSVQKEFDNRTKTSAFKLDQMKSQFLSLAIDLGNVLIPVINDLVSAVSPLIKGFANWARENKSIVSGIAKVALLVGGLTGVFSLVTGAISLGAKAIRVLNYTTKIYNATLGVFTLLSGKSAMGIRNNSVALKAYTVVARIASLINPLGWIAIGVAAVAAIGYAIYKLTDSFNGLNRAQELQQEVEKRALKSTIDQRVEVALLFKTLRRAEEGTKLYTDTLDKIEKIQPGITEQFNLQIKSIDALNEAEKNLTKSIIKRAEEQVRGEMIVEKTRAAMERAENGPGWTDYLASFGTAVGTLGMGYMSPTDLVNSDVAELNKDRDILIGQQTKSQLEVANPAKAQSNAMSETIKQTTENVVLDFVNMPSWMKVNSSKNGELKQPSTGSTKQN